MQPYLEFALSLAKEAGTTMLENFSLGMAKEWKEDHSPLTLTDTAINALVIERVKSTYPDHGVLGEEASFSQDRDYVWVVDPVDGTIPFSHGVPTFAFSLALTHKGESIVGVVNDPIMKRLIWAEKGKGAFLNGKLIHVSEAKSIAHTIMNVDGPQNKEFPIGNLPSRINENIGKITKFSCIVYGGILVAIGEYSAAVCAGSFPWDIAALKLIVEEAGGKVTSLRGEEQLYNKEIQGALISNGHVHEEILSLI